MLRQPVKGGNFIPVDRLIRADGGGISTRAHRTHINLAVGIFQADTCFFNAFERDG